jgi:CPA1 family monovalent cation:H+ antiporter
MSDTTREHLDAFWELIDEILNAVLFVIIGLEFLAIRLQQGYVVMAFSAILIVMISRYVSVAVLVKPMAIKHQFSKGVIEILTWGGLRGGISIALALSLPPVPERQLVLAATYVVVVFSVLIQGLTIGKVVAARTNPHPKTPN